MVSNGSDLGNEGYADVLGHKHMSSWLLKSSKRAISSKLQPSVTSDNRLLVKIRSLHKGCSIMRLVMWDNSLLPIGIYRSL